MATDQADELRRTDSERLDWLASKATRNSAYMWLPTLFCSELLDLRAAIDATIGREQKEK